MLNGEDATMPPPTRFVSGIHLREITKPCPVSEEMRVLTHHAIRAFLRLRLIIQTLLLGSYA